MAPLRAALLLAHVTVAAARATPISGGRNPFLAQLNDALPHVQVRVAPSTTLKLRKNIRWLSTLLSFGADYSTQQGLWTLKRAPASNARRGVARGSRRARAPNS